MSKNNYIVCFTLGEQNDVTMRFTPCNYSRIVTWECYTLESIIAMAETFEYLAKSAREWERRIKEKELLP